MNRLRSKTDLERVDFTLNLLNIGLHSLGKLLNRVEKNDARAELFRKDGNNQFKLCAYEEAITLYTKSVSMATSDSSELQLAFGNRSAAFFQLKMYEECLADIELVIAKNCSIALREKLLKRKAEALQLLPTQIKTPFYLELASIAEKDRHPKIQSASNAIAIKRNSQFGRHIIAQRDIKVGEILIVEKPITQVLAVKTESLCSECAELCYNLIPCENCTVALYCNESCKQTAFVRYHQYECPIAASLRDFNATVALSARIAFVTRDEWNTADLDAYGSSTRSEPYRSDRYKELHGLITHDADLSEAKIYDQSLLAASVFWLVQNETNFFDNYDADQFKRIIFRLIQVMPFNAISHHQLIFQYRENMCQIESMSHGIYSVCALLNHSCFANIASYNCGNTQIVYAVARIKKDEQCFINYKFESGDCTKAMRQQQLLEIFLFRCTCIVCVEDWPLKNDLPSLSLVPFFDENITGLAVTGRDPIFMKEVRLKLIQYLEKWGQFMPSSNVMLARRQLMACFNGFGNVKVPLKQSLMG